MASKAALKEGAKASGVKLCCQPLAAGRTPHGAAEVAAEFAGKARRSDHACCSRGPCFRRAQKAAMETARRNGASPQEASWIGNADGRGTQRNHLAGCGSGRQSSCQCSPDSRDDSGWGAHVSLPSQLSFILIRAAPAGVCARLAAVAAARAAMELLAEADAEEATRLQSFLQPGENANREVATFAASAAYTAAVAAGMAPPLAAKAAAIAASKVP